MNELLSQEKYAERLSTIGKKRYIHIKKEDREFIMKAFKVTERTVLNAVSFDKKRGNTELAKRIRKLAMERGCIVMVRHPEMETLFDADRYMRQYLPNDVLLEFSLEDGGCDVFYNGEKVRRYENVDVKGIQSIQNWAMSLK